MTNTTAIPRTTDTVLGEVRWLDHLGRRHSTLPRPVLLEKELYRAQRSRKPKNYRGRRNYNGLHWFSASGEHVWYESMMERRALLWLDFHCDIVTVAAQPMKMFFPDGTVHYPDFIALHGDAEQRQVVYNVKPAGLITAKVQRQFDNATAMCEQVGWTHEVISAFDPAEIANIEWLANFRQPHFAPTERMAEQLHSRLDRPMPVFAAAELIEDAPWQARMGALYNLVWNREISIDLTTPFTNNTLVRKAS